MAFEFALSKKYQADEGTALVAGLKFNAVNGLLTAVIFFGLNGFRLEFSLYSLMIAFAMSLCGMVYSIIGFRVLKSGGMALCSVFLMIGGMLLPYLFGILYLYEQLTLPRIIGIVVILAAVILSNKASYKLKLSTLLLCCCVFVLSGSVSILSKCHQVATAYPSVGSTAFVMYSGIGKFLFSSLALLLCKKDMGTRFFTKSSRVWVIAGAALIGGVSYMLQLIGAKALPASVLYPMVTGGSIIFSAISGRVFFKEKLSVWQLVSIRLCFVGTLLFL